LVISLLCRVCVLHNLCFATGLPGYDLKFCKARGLQRNLSFCEIMFKPGKCARCVTLDRWPLRIHQLWLVRASLDLSVPGCLYRPPSYTS
jgi:hypothetical protein